MDEETYSALSEAIDTLFPSIPKRDRRDRDSYGDYGLDVKANVTRSRPLYGSDDLILNSVTGARNSMPDQLRERYVAARELAVEDRTRDLILERREIIGEELQKRLQLERYSAAKIRQNKIDNDGVGWMADYSDLDEQGTLTYEGIMELDKRYPNAKYSPDVRSLKETDFMADLKNEWETNRQQQLEQNAAQQAVPFQRQQQEADMDYKSEQASQLLDPSQRQIFSNAVANGMRPTQAMGLLERQQAFTEDANKLRGLGVGKDVIEGMVEKDPTTGETYFNREKLGELQSDLGFIKQADEALKNYSDRIKALRSNSGGLADLADDKKTSVIAEYEKQMDAIQKAKSAVERRVMGEDNPVVQSQDAVNEFLNRFENTPQGQGTPTNNAPRTEQDNLTGE